VATADAVSGGATGLVPQDVFTGQDFYVPAFAILIGGAKNIVQDVLNITYTDNLKDIDSFELTVNNWDPDKAPSGESPFKYSDEATFNPWQPIELWMGYMHNGVDERQKMLTGEITTMTPVFPASGGSTLSVRALNLLHRFRTTQQTKAFVKRKDSEIAELIVTDIAREIRKNMPLTLQLDAVEIAGNKKKEQPVPYLVMQNQYPIQFLLARSRDIGYELFVEEAKTRPGSKERIVTLHFRPTAAAKQIAYKMEWGKSLISFQPTLQTANQVSSVTVRGWDPAGKTKIEKTVKRSEIEGVVQPVADLKLDETGLSQKLEIMVDHPIQDQAEADVLCKQTMLRLAQGIVEAKGKTIGLPNLRAGNKIEIKGLGKRFSGVYLVTSTTHSMGEGGYTTDFSARMEAKVGPQ
jgi:phage protein D